jgi:hypothetical protein
LIKRNVAAAIGAMVLAAGGSAAAFGGTANATVSQGANGVIYGSGGTPQASYDASNNTWTLESPTSPGASAQIDLVNPANVDIVGQGTGGPGISDGPSFEASAVSGGDPRWVLEFHDGCSLVGTPTAANSSNFTWSAEPGGGQGMSWEDAFTWLEDGGGGACGADAQVTAAYIVDDTGSNGVPTTLSDVMYGSENVVPYSSSTTNSAQGPIKNSKSGKCLDVTGGQFTSGTTLQQYTCGASVKGVKGADQKFEIVTHDVNGAVTGYLEAISPPGTVLYVSAPNSGGQLELSATRGADTDMLKSGSYYTFPEAPGSVLSPIGTTLMVMDDSGSSTANGAKIISDVQNDGSSQQWSMP